MLQMEIQLKKEHLWEYSLAPIPLTLESGADTPKQGGVPSLCAPKGIHLQTRDLDIRHANPSPF